MHTRIPHALPAEMDWDGGVEAAVPDGPENMGYVVHAVASNVTDWLCPSSHRREKGWEYSCTAGLVAYPCPHPHASNF